MYIYDYICFFCFFVWRGAGGIGVEAYYNFGVLPNYIFNLFQQVKIVNVQTMATKYLASIKVKYDFRFTFRAINTFMQYE